MRTAMANARISSLARSLAWLATSPSARGMAPVLSAPRRVHGLGRNLRWQQAQSPGLLNCDIAPLPLPPLGRQWFFASEEAAADAAIACNVQLVPPAPPSARSEALSLASTLKKRVTKMNKHKARKRRKRDRMKKRTN
jgi:hypothetical protein